VKKLKKYIILSSLAIGVLFYSFNSLEEVTNKKTDKTIQEKPTYKTGPYVDFPEKENETVIIVTTP
jgi:hypothetical protein